MNIIFDYLIIIAAEVLILPTGEMVSKRFGKGEIARKWGHILSGTLLWLLSYLLFGNTIHTVIIATLFAVISTILCYTGKIECDKREDRSLNNLKSTPLQGIGHIIFASLAYSNINYMAAYGVAVFTLCFGDAFAALIGSKFGKYSIELPHNKSLIGFISFILAALIAITIPLSLVNVHLAIWKLLLIVFSSAVVEIYSGDWDNLLIQLMAGFMTIILL